MDILMTDCIHIYLPFVFKLAFYLRLIYSLEISNQFLNYFLLIVHKQGIIRKFEHEVNIENVMQCFIIFPAK